MHLTALLVVVASGIALVSPHHYHGSGSGSDFSGEGWPHGYNHHSSTANARSSPDSSTPFAKFRGDTANYYWDGGKPNTGGSFQARSQNRNRYAPNQQTHYSPNPNEAPNSRNSNAYSRNFLEPHSQDSFEGYATGRQSHDTGKSWALYNSYYDSNRRDSNFKSANGFNSNVASNGWKANARNLNSGSPNKWFTDAEASNGWAENPGSKLTNQWQSTGW
ncbi:bifunctional endo-1,4-beta-xylanase XylA [Plutella xylostella]|uniref:bifunctional endo-1,4-beta-xylanase XylA n=1 Tax=Plutella xylostella TaxID=51655 RepID=UPI0020325591|nr:bifunctional endo-1,4-beta-xylanase XylA [Plutella xylostella]